MQDNTFSLWFAEQLLDIGAVRLQPNQPFRWSSGWLSPIYCDNRLTLSYPQLRKQITRGLCKLIREYFPSVEGIAGVATAGIAQGVLVADMMDLPFCYVRPKPKEHGTASQIEGRLQAQQPIVLVEDLISTGSSSLRAAQALQQAGARVVGVVAMVSYDFNHARQAFEQAQLPYYSLTNYDTLIQVWQKQQPLQADMEAILNGWRQDPAHWQPPSR